MHIFARIVAGDLPVKPARANDGHLVGEVDKPLQHARRTFHLRPDISQLLATFKTDLSLAIIAHPAGFKDRGRANGGNGVFQLLQIFNICIRRDGQAETLQKLLLIEPVL